MLTEQQLAEIQFDNLARRFPKRYRVKARKILRALSLALAEGDGYTDLVIQQVQDNLYAPNSTGQCLNAVGARYGVERTISSNIGDDTYRKLIPVLGLNKKKITRTFLKALNAVYGPYLTSANLTAQNPEPYRISSGGDLRLTIDAHTSLKLEFTTADAANLSAATAQELALAISQKSNGRVLGSVKTDSKTGLNYLNIRTKTLGNQGFLQVAGGDAQSSLRFHSIRSTQQGLTRWAVTRYGTQDEMLFTYSSGTNPNLTSSGVQIGDNVTIRQDSGFNARNVGTFPVTYVDATSFRVKNNQGLPETVTQLHADDLTFYLPEPANILRNSQLATVLELVPGEFTIVMPVTAPVVRRDSSNAFYLKGAVANATAATWNGTTGTLTLDKSSAFSSSGSIRPLFSRTMASGVVQSITSNSITLISASGFPTKGAVFSPATQQYYYYSGISGQTLQNVQPQPNASMIQCPATYAEHYLYTSISGGALQGVFPDPTGLLGFRVGQCGAAIVADQEGSYIYDPKGTWMGTDTSTTLSQKIANGDYATRVTVQNNANFPDQGYVMFEPNTGNADGPYQYLGKLGTTQLVLNAKQPFGHTHVAGTTVRLVTLGGYVPSPGNVDRAVYLTSTAPARDQLEVYIRKLTASGFVVNFLIVLPSYQRSLPLQIFATSPTATSL